LFHCQENRGKRERAEKKIQEEKAVQEQQQKEVMELRVKIERLTHMKGSLEQHVNKHKIYEVRRKLSKLAQQYHSPLVFGRHSAQMSARTPAILTEVCHGFFQSLQLRHYATSWKVAGSIPDEVIGFFN
jgi:predicted RNase H-like nuclease (RuvC/YqgF family)